MSLTSIQMNSNILKKFQFAKSFINLTPDTDYKNESFLEELLDHYIKTKNIPLPENLSLPNKANSVT